MLAVTLAIQYQLIIIYSSTAVVPPTGHSFDCHSSWDRSVCIPSSLLQAEVMTLIGWSFPVPPLPNSTSYIYLPRLTCGLAANISSTEWFHSVKSWFQLKPHSLCITPVVVSPDEAPVFSGHTNSQMMTAHDTTVYQTYMGNCMVVF